MGGGQKAKVPKPTPQELEIQKMQLASLRAQEADMKLMRPFLLQSMRLKEVKTKSDKTGKTVTHLKKMTEDEYVSSLSEDERRQYKNILLAQERETKALKGELPLTAEGQKEKAEEFIQFKEAMARVGSSISGDTPEGASATDTSGIQALGAFNRAWGLREEAERRGELDTGSAMVLNRLGTSSNLSAVNYNARGGVTGFYAPLQQGAASAIDPYIRRAQMGTEASITNAKIAVQKQQMYMKMGIAIAGAAMGGIGGAMAASAAGTSMLAGGMTGAAEGMAGAASI